MVMAIASSQAAKGRNRIFVRYGYYITFRIRMQTFVCRNPKEIQWQEKCRRKTSSQEFHGAGRKNKSGTNDMIQAREIKLRDDMYHDILQAKEAIAMDGMPVTTKTFMSGRSQAVRIPKEYRFPQNDEELYINKVGDAVILIPRESIRNTFLQGLHMVTEDFLADGRPEELPNVREDL